MPRTIAALVVLLTPAAAWAGGEEIPEHGAQALGRGGAFTAKADDLTALQYNVAGLAMARGTRVLFSANIVNASAEFQDFLRERFKERGAIPIEEIRARLS